MLLSKHRYGMELLAGADVPITLAPIGCQSIRLDDS